MSIESVAPVASALPLASPAAARMPEAVPVGVDFGALVGEGLQRVDASLREADARVRSLAAGEEVALHDVMISMEQARLDLMLVVEVRNRLVEAYQELSRMQL
jgi:flagellar hook-basal body complex protein FliE